MMPHKTSSTTSANRKVSARNPASATTPGPDSSAMRVSAALSTVIRTSARRSRCRTVPDRLAVRSDNLLPALLGGVPHFRRHRDIIELLCKLAAVAIGPIEEIESGAGVLRFRLLLVHQDEAGAGDRPAVFARLVGQEQVEARRFRPVRIRGCRLEALAVRGNEFAVVVAQQRVGELVLLSEGVLDIADRAVGARRQRGDPLIALAPKPAGKFDRRVLADRL